MLLMKKRSIHTLETLRRYDEGEITFEECFGNSIKFIRMVRVGFYYGSPCVLKWKPFNEGMEKWPSDERIWIQYLRFVALYHDQNVRLNWLIDVLTQKKDRSFLVKNSIFQAKRIRKSRSRAATSEIKKILATIDRKIRQERMLSFGFWRGVEESSYSTIYDVSLSLRKLSVEVESDFRRLVNIYPNNPLVCQRYALFLREIAQEPFKAQQWIARVEYLNRTKSYVTDLAEEQGMKVFPLIPARASGELVVSKLGSDVSVEDDSESKSDKEQPTTNSTTTNVVNELAYRRSSYAEMGKRLSVKPIIYMIAILFLVCVVCIAGGFFVFSGLSWYSHSSFVEEFKMVRYMGYLADELGVALFEIYKYGLQCGGILLTEEEAAKLMPKKGTEPEFSSMWIQEIANAVNNAATNVQRYAKRYLRRISHDATSDIVFLNMSLILDSGNALSYSCNFLEAMNGICSRICYFDGTKCVNSDQELWFLYLQENTWRFVDCIEAIARKSCYDMNGGISNVNLVAKGFETLLLGIGALFVIFFFYQNTRLQKCWTRVVHIIHSIPKIVIRTEFRQTEQEDEKRNQEEDRYANIFIQCITSRETSGGLPVRRTIVYMILICAFVVVGIIIQFIVTRDQNRILVSLPIRYESTARLIGNLLGLMQSFERAVAAYHGRPYRNDTYTQLLTDIDSLLAVLTQNLVDFEFGQWQDIQIGCLSSERGLIDWILDSSKMPNWVEEPYEHDRIAALPTLVRLDLVVEMFADASFVGGNVSNTNIKVLLAEHFGVSHLMLNLITVLMDTYARSVETRVDLMKLILFSTATGMAMICIALVVLLIINLTDIRNVFRQCVTLVARIDPDHIADSPALEGLFDGNFGTTAVARKRNIGATLMQYSVLPDLVVIVNQRKTIMHINKSALDTWGSDCEFCVDKELSSLITFNEVFDRYLDDVAHYRRTLIDPMDIEYTIVPTDTTYSSSVRVFTTSGDRERSTIIMIRADEPVLKRQMCYEELEKQLTFMKKSALPSQLRDEIMVNKDNTFTSTNTVIMAVQCPDILVHQKAHNVDGLKHALRVLTEGVSHMISESSDAALWKCVGETRLICFNIRSKALNIHNVITESIRASKICYDHMKRGNVGVKISILQCKKMIVGWISAEMNFGVYAKQVSRAYVLVNKAAADCLITTIKISDFLPPDVIERCETVDYSVKKSATQVRLSLL